MGTKISIDEVSDLILKCRGIVYTCGNGGSSATASHFTQDLIKACGVRSICISDNIPFITATANDDSYDNVFMKYMEVFWEYGDLLFMISGSGNSKNLLNVADYLKGSIRTVALVGFDGGKLKDLADYYIHVPINDMRVSENKHIDIIHEIIDRLAYDQSVYKI